MIQCKGVFKWREKPIGELGSIHLHALGRPNRVTSNVWNASWRLCALPGCLNTSRPENLRSKRPVGLQRGKAMDVMGWHCAIALLKRGRSALGELILDGAPYSLFLVPDPFECPLLQAGRVSGAHFGDIIKALSSPSPCRTLGLHPTSYTLCREQRKEVPHGSWEIKHKC